jgi:hypothetical protein
MGNKGIIKIFVITQAQKLHINFENIVKLLLENDESTTIAHTR